MSRIFMPEAWSPETPKSNEISWDGVFAEHGAGQARRLEKPVSRDFGEVNRQAEELRRSAPDHYAFCHPHY